MNYMHLYKYCTLIEKYSRTQREETIFPEPCKPLQEHRHECENLQTSAYSITYSIKAIVSHQNHIRFAEDTNISMLQKLPA